MAITRSTRPYVFPKTRKTRYALDTEYREKAKHFSRRSYRRRAAVELENCLHSLDFLTERGHMEDARMPNGEVKNFHVFYLTEAAKMLQKRYQTIWRWISNGVIPAPVLVAKLDKGQPHEVYHVDEVRVLIEEIGKHENTVAYFRKDHVHVTMRIEQRIADIRKTLFS